MLLSFSLTFIIIYSFGAFGNPHVDTYFLRENNLNLVVNGISNSFHYWTLDPIFSLIFKYVPNLLIPLQGAVFASGLNFWLKRYVTSSNISTGLALSIATLIISLFGYDITIWSALTWVPWCFLLFETVLLKGSFSVIALLFIYLASKAGHELSIVTFLIWFSFRVFSVEQEKQKLFGVLALFSFLFSIKELLLFTAPPFPEYPPFSRVLWPIYPHLDPSVGPHLPLPIIDREYLAPILLIFGGILSTAGIVSYSLKNKKDYSILVFILGFILIWDSMHFPPESGGEIGPLAALSRMVSGLSFHSLGLFVLSFSFIFLPFLALFQRGLVVSLVAAATLFSISLYEKKPILLGDKSQNFLLEMQRSKEAYKLGLSPSFLITKKDPFGIISLRERMQGISKRNLSRFPNTLSSSHNEDLLTRINSNKLGDRWTSGGGKQTGNEWLHIYLESPLNLEGIKITTGWYSGDFPRGIKILGKESCSNDKKSDFEGYKEVFSANPWLGALQFTPDGYPYIEPRHLGTFLFPSIERIQCLLIKQTGEEPQLDWSISEIFLLLTK